MTGTTPSCAFVTTHITSNMTAIDKHEVVSMILCTASIDTPAHLHMHTTSMMAIINLNAFVRPTMRNMITDPSVTYTIHEHLISTTVSSSTTRMPNRIRSYMHNGTTRLISNRTASGHSTMFDSGRTDSGRTIQHRITVSTSPDNHSIDVLLIAIAMAARSTMGPCTETAHSHTRTTTHASTLLAMMLADGATLLARILAVGAHRKAMLNHIHMTARSLHISSECNSHCLQTMTVTHTRTSPLG